MCGQENPEQLKECIAAKEEELRKFLDEGGVLKRA